MLVLVTQYALAHLQYLSSPLVYDLKTSTIIAVAAGKAVVYGSERIRVLLTQYALSHLQHFYPEPYSFLPLVSVPLCQREFSTISGSSDFGS